MGFVNQASILHGTTITLYTETETGTDKFNRPILTETAISVDNVLIAQPSEQEVLDTLNLTGRKLVYVLGIPKGDLNEWTNKKVEFFGREFKTIGSPVEGLESMIPLEWNKKVRCEEVNGQG